MNRTCLTTFVLFTGVSLLSADTLQFGEGDLAFQMEFARIGSPGNQPELPPNDRDSTMHPIGAVSYEYEIGKFEVSCRQLAIGKLLGDVDGPQFSIGAACTPDGEDAPAFASWNQAAQFATWLNISSGHGPAYRINALPNGTIGPTLWQPGESGYDPENPLRNSLAKYALPTADEWHKAAYYDPVTETYNLYATGNQRPSPLSTEGGVLPDTAFFDPEWPFGFTNVHTAGGLSAFGTMGQTGNAFEWEESPFDPEGDLLGARAVRLHRNEDPLTVREGFTRTSPGFRIVSLLTRKNPFGDLDSDGRISIGDIEILSENVRLGLMDARLDLNGDGTVNQSDRTFWVEQLAGTRFGDADLDGTVDFDDFVTLAKSFNQQVGWAGGDFDGSGTVDFDDFVTLANNLEVQQTEVSSVPEPCSRILAVLTFSAILLLRARIAAIRNMGLATD